MLKSLLVFFIAIKTNYDTLKSKTFFEVYEVTQSRNN